MVTFDVMGMELENNNPHEGALVKLWRFGKPCEMAHVYTKKRNSRLSPVNF